MPQKNNDKIVFTGINNPSGFPFLKTTSTGIKIKIKDIKLMFESVEKNDFNFVPRLILKNKYGISSEFTLFIKIHRPAFFKY